jgi:ribosome-binding factor A
MSRIEKINQALKKEISNIIQNELNDPRLGFITITKVEITKDLHIAKVSFSVLGDATAIKNAEAGLKSAAGFIRKLIGDRVKMRYTPELLFKRDSSAEYSVRIFEQLERIKNESKKSR